MAITNICKIKKIYCIEINEYMYDYVRKIGLYVMYRFSQSIKI